MYDNSESQGIFDQGNHNQKLTPYVDVNIRHGFIKKVFSIVGAQLLLTSLIALPFQVFHAQAVQFIGGGGGILVWIALALTMGLVCYMTCKPEAGRHYPTNYYLLGGITVGFGILVGVICLQYTGQSVLIVTFMTAAITFSLTAFATQTKYDFTGFGPYLFAAMVGLFIFGFILMFVHSQLAHTIYAGCGALLFSFYIIYDVQLIVGGDNKKHEFGVDDYVFAALHLYLDIINLFLYLLELFGDRR